MMEFLAWSNAVLCLAAMLFAYGKSGDVFHPLLLIMPMFLFMYSYMPLRLLVSEELFLYVTVEQATFAAAISLLSVTFFIMGSIHGSGDFRSRPTTRMLLDRVVVQRGAILIGVLGLMGWGISIATVGGLRAAYGQAYGGGWNDVAYIRDLTHLLIPALLLLLSPAGYDPTKLWWWCTVFTFAAPWLMQGLLGARRGPTFVVVVSVAMSWYLARNRRPPLVATLTGGFALGLLMLVLVANRDRIYLGSEFDVDISATAKLTEVSPANEFIFATGCIATTRQTQDYYWGRRVLAYIFVRPIPRQLWPDKYGDLGLRAIEQNSGVAGEGMQLVMGWPQVPGAAPGMAADLWVEFSWLSIPLAGLFGWVYGRSWHHAVTRRGYSGVQYVILITAAIYLVTQGMADALFRLLVCSIPAYSVWRLASRAA